MTLLKTALAGAALALFFLASTAAAHDFWINHGGYKSPVDGTHCCGNNDCFALPAEDMQIDRRAAGCSSRSARRCPYSEAQPSEDGEFWRCKRYDGSRRCFFAPQPIELSASRDRAHRSVSFSSMRRLRW